jgi:uncharacterized protein (DUF302 family)
MGVYIKVVCAAFLLCFSFSLQAADAYMMKKSPYSVDETLDRLEAVLKKKGITVFARVDHKAGANKVGIDMQPTQLLIFGNPKMGTPLMNENRLMGLDLPMKALAWRDDKSQVWLAYLNPAELQQRHNIKNQKIINKMTQALNGLTNKALN